jgi:hypothetical protein
MQNHPWMVCCNTFLARSEIKHQFLSNHQGQAHLSSFPCFLMTVFMVRKGTTV